MLYKTAMIVVVYTMICPVLLPETRWGPCPWDICLNALHPNSMACDNPKVSLGFLGVSGTDSYCFLV